jgi:hypothetical protein
LRSNFDFFRFGSHLKSLKLVGTLDVPWPLTAPLQMTEPLRNALIESFVIHLRNLIDFFYPGQVQAL